MMFTELKEKAENGDIQSMNELARCYSMGIDTEVDYDLAFEYLNKASNLGDPVAMSNLAVFYSLGVSVNKDTRMALKLFHDAACKGAMITEYVFQYIRKDEMEKLASEGCAAAAYYYALSLDNSESQKRDVLIKSASEKRLALATCALAAKSCFSNPTKDNQEAKKLFLQAVDSGYDYFYMLCNIALTIQQLGLDDGIIDLVRFFLRNRYERPYILVKITGRQWAERLINNGEIFTRSLGGFREISKPGVGDPFEGVANTNNASPFWKEIEEESLSEMATYGMFDEYMAHERIYCLYTLELSETGELVPPDIRMNQFGDSAVIIWDGIEFIRRIKAALIKKYGDSIWFGYRRVEYDVIPTKTQVYTEFSKTEPYSWQNEFRLVVDPANGRIERNEWERMTDVAKMMYINPGGKVELFEDPGSDLITIGDISDICSIYSIDEFLSISTDIAEKANPYRVEGPENQEHRKKTFLYRPFIKF